MILQTLVVGPLAVNCYIIADEHAREAIVIDPGGDAQKISDALRQHRLRVTQIVNTHAHFDHCGAIDDIRREWGAPFAIHSAEKDMLASANTTARMFGLDMAPVKPPDRWLEEGDMVTAANVHLQVIHTPGHSPGGICLYDAQNKILFSGDTLFHGSIGRTDFPGCSLSDLLTSIKTKLLTLPGDTTVYPGHGVATSIGEENLLNPFLKNYV